MRAIGKYIVITVLEEEKKASSGLILTSSEFEDLRYGLAEVSEPGSDVSVVSKGSKIYYDKRNCFAIRIDGVQYHVILERDVVLVLD
jgi:co-chaperonin GroES (HSP10)